MHRNAWGIWEIRVRRCPDQYLLYVVEGGEHPEPLGVPVLKKVRILVIHSQQSPDQAFYAETAACGLIHSPHHDRNLDRVAVREGSRPFRGSAQQQGGVHQGNLQHRLGETLDVDPQASVLIDGPHQDGQLHRSHPSQRRLSRLESPEDRIPWSRGYGRTPRASSFRGVEMARERD